MFHRILTRILSILTLCCCIGCKATIYFPSDTYRYLLGPNTQPNTTVAEVIALSKNPNQHNAAIVYSLEATRLEGHCSARNNGAKVDVQQLFGIEDSANGRIVLIKKLPSYDMYKGCSFKHLIHAREEVPLHAETIRSDNLAPSLMSTLPSKIDVVIKTTVDIHLPRESLRCFARPIIRLQLYVSTPSESVYVLNPRPSSTEISFEYNLLQDNTDNNVVFDNQSSGITVMDLKGELRNTFSLLVECSIRMVLQSNASFERIATTSEVVNVSLTFVSERDSLLSPIFLGTRSIVVTENRIQYNRLVDARLTLPKDITYGWTYPMINISDAALYSYHRKSSSGNIIVDLLLLKTLSYNMSAIHHLSVTIWNDPTMDPFGYSEPSNWTDVPARTLLTYRIDVHIQAMEFKFENRYSKVKVYRNASALSRVALNAVPTYISSGRTIIYSLRLPGSPGDSIRLQPNSGILYIANETTLLATNITRFNLTMYAMDITDEFDETITTNSTIEIQLLDADPNNCSGSAYCSKFFKEADCIRTSCAFGSPDGWCRWRPDTTSSRSRNGSYGTCSPDLSSCPDNVCDEIEKENTAICLQDCADKVIGMIGIPDLRKGSSNTLGITNGWGVCKCEMLNDGSMCNCFRPVTPRTTKPWNITTVHPVSSKPSQEGFDTITFRKPAVVPSEDGPCNDTCIIVLTSVMSVVLAVTLVFVVILMLYKRYPCSGRVSGTQYKPGLIGTPDGLLNTVPSEYVDDGFMLQRIKSEYDAKWEFPRANLILEDILGEGEFGRVMMAQALGIRGHTGYQTVAVKMLKNSATNAELQDLITELSLLKQVNHPNVINLLGASTQKGPLFVIVEYCKHGSLKSFLRLHRKVTHISYIHSEPTSISIGPRDLISFAWQVCKGMHYLASMKLVHRDLAARNVLVSEGLIIKISDFGLTRDIYEGDTYMKKSKSRVPVKWMAIEALYDNVYTIKSDVWSFGILLWEIVTMGATPYPGLPSERLYQILKNGYRMEKPDGCSDELFRIMQRCWQLVPTSRASFHELADVFEKMLEKDSEYLDLSATLPIDSDNDSDAEDQIDTSAMFRPAQQINEDEETSLKVLLSNATYSKLPLSASKSSDHETSFTGSPMETDQECIGDEDSYYCGENTQTETV